MGLSKEAPFKLVEGRLPLVEDLQITSVTRESDVAFSEATKDGSLPKKLLVNVEAIHAITTRNYTSYPASSLEASAPSWMDNYGKPVIKNHDIHEEPLGRVTGYEYRESQLSPGTMCIALTLSITDPVAIEKILDGRYKTLSIGGSTNRAICSVCGKNITEEYCGHWKGRKYEGKVCTYIIGEMNFDEISFVNAPADVNAQVVSVKPVTQESIKQEQTSSEEGRVTLVTAPIEEGLDLLNQVDTLLDEETEPETTATTETPVGEGSEGEGTEEPVAEGNEPGEPAGEEAPNFEEQIQTLNDRVAQLEAELETAKGEAAGLQEQLTQAQAEVTRLGDELGVANEENTRLIKQNTGFARLVHRQLAERVVDLKVNLGEAEAENREALVNESIKESASKLNEEISGLLTKAPQRIAQKVTMSDVPKDGDEEVTESTKNQKQTPTAEEYVKTFVSYMARTRTE